MHPGNQENFEFLTTFELDICSGFTELDILMDVLHTKLDFW